MTTEKELEKGSAWARCSATYQANTEDLFYYLAVQPYKNFDS